MKEYIYQVVFINGYIGGKDRVVAEFESGPEAKTFAMRSRRSLSKGERSYYKCTYITKKIAK